MKRRYWIGGIVLLLAAAYLLYLSFGSSVSYYVTVSEFCNRGTELYDTDIRVAGKIAEGSVDWDARELELRFTIRENDNTMNVLYNGAKPTLFEEGGNVLVEGKYGDDGVLHADQLLFKCPSKYEPAE